MTDHYRTSLRQSLIEQSDPRTKAWWEGYVKQSAPFLGVKMAAVRSTIHHWYKERIAGNVPPEEQLSLALALFTGEYTEEKLAGTLFLQEILLPVNAVQCARDLDRFAELFTKGHIYDWNVCDWFCIKLLGDLIKREGRACAGSISEWQSADNLWQARASLVTFVPVAGNSDYYELIEGACQAVIKRQERFAKTAVGWILRDISRYDEAFVHRVVRENLNDFSTESLKNATKYLAVKERADYLQGLKRARHSV